MGKHRHSHKGHRHGGHKGHKHHHRHHHQQPYRYRRHPNCQQRVHIGGRCDCQYCRDYNINQGDCCIIL